MLTGRQIVRFAAPELPVALIRDDQSLGAQLVQFAQGLLQSRPCHPRGREYKGRKRMLDHCDRAVKEVG
jgi:hypothetical protein